MDVDKIIAGLSDRDVATLLSSLPADCCEYWAPEPTDDARLCSNDCVLTETGLAVRARLLGEG